ncbi:molybdopterin-dependent oxidoreductase [Natronosporangium hydrolyticum]|uniref:Molybdopterin-dependent oxidoreductase n=1 Tax=Natronosporangium hydrolyticum TaxID=2811111 RepID=A0A895YDF7_9ACTN|nr:molybdopterin-dependent oxidoreductase [Natronosporangium hydrolyticum]QSB15581.1 molybdopterin-dependent oxidoreductase [Natronosporangium hydrolyticum]
MTSRATGALTGLAAAATAVAVAELAAVFTGPATAPLTAVGSTVIDHAPAIVVEFGIGVFGHYDKVALFTGVLLLLAGAAAAIGTAAVRPGRSWLAYLGLAGFAGVGLAAVLTRPGAAPTAALPTLLGAAVAAGLFRVAIARVVSDGSPIDPASAPDRDQPSRRSVVRALGWGLGAAVMVGASGRWLSNQRGVATARSAVELPQPVDPAAPVPAGADRDLPDLTPYVTGNDSFYRIDTALVVPRIDPATWRLRIHGRVRHPYELSFEELLARPMVARHITLACVSNEVGGELVGNASWLGVPVADLLAAAQPLPGADQVVSRASDGWTCGTPTEALTDGRDALLAVGMNGEPLPLEHGFPVRMVVPGLYGYVSACKWLTELELSSFDDFDAYWVRRGWSAQAPIKTQSRIDTPRRRAAAGVVTVAGVAWAQQRGIERVEVRVDGGPWQEATLADTVSADTWRQWWWRWEASPGEHTLTVRATDTTGQPQPADLAPPAPDGATGWHSVRIDVA